MRLIKYIWYHIYCRTNIAQIILNSIDLANDFTQVVTSRFV